MRGGGGGGGTHGGIWNWEGRNRWKRRDGVGREGDEGRNTRRKGNGGPKEGIAII